MAEKVFLISLDGATLDVLRPLMAQGCLPNLQGVMERGLAVELESIVPPVTAAAWTSFMTGKHPSKHGIFDFTYFNPRDYSCGINNAGHIRSKTIWQILSEQGKRVVVLNLPYTYPPAKVNGVVVSGWDVPSNDVNFTYPAELRSEILQMMPEYGDWLELSLWKHLSTSSNEEFDNFADKLTASFLQGTRLAMFFLERESWDVFMVHFQQTDWIQHKLWDYIERACRDQEDKSPRLEKVRDCYRRFDEQIGILLNRVQPTGALTIILSDHGFGRYHGSICPNYYLKRWGYYNVVARPGDGVKDIFRNSGWPTLRKLYGASAGVKRRLVRRGAHKEYRSYMEQEYASVGRQSEIDWSHTKAAFVEGSEVAFIYVNLVGRSAQGIVQPGTEYDHLLSDLITRFSALRHPKTKEKLLLRVGRGSEFYPEIGSGILVPDLILVPLEGYGFSSQETLKPSNQGNHRSKGVLLMQGNVLIERLRSRPCLIDIAPTILHALGLEVPTDMDGGVLEEIFAAARPVRYEVADNSRAEECGLEYATGESELLEERLRGLGYLS